MSARKTSPLRSRPRKNLARDAPIMESTLPRPRLCGNEKLYHIYIYNFTESCSGPSSVDMCCPPRIANNIIGLKIVGKHGMKDNHGPVDHGTHAQWPHRC